MDRLLSMRVFERVVDEGSFAAAARALGLAPAGVTRLVEDLERSLSARLLNRTTRKLSLTQAGETYLARIRPILIDIEEAQEAVKTQTQEMGGTVRLCATPTAAFNVLAPAVADFHRLYPAVTFEIQVSDTPATEIEHFDVTFVRDDDKIDADVVVRPVLPVRFFLCGTPGYLRAHGTPRKPEELAKHRLLRERLTGTRLKPLKLLNPQEGDRSVEIDAPAPMIANDLNTVMQAALAGAGLGLFPELVAQSLQAESRLVRVLAPWVGAESLRLLAAMPSRRYTPLRTRTFLDFVVEYAQARTHQDGAPMADWPSQPIASRRTKLRAGPQPGT